MAEEGHLRPGGGSEQEFTFRNVQLLKNETLGTGSYGAVCKAKCDQLICAAKILYPALQTPASGNETFHQFQLKCRFLCHINHPNIVQYLGTYRDPETNAPVLLMELMDKSLTHFLESSPGDIPYHIQVNLSQDIAQALAFLHDNGIIHRDLSSNNVLLIAGSRAKVSDFGISKFVDITQLAQCPGTPAFMSPEALDEPPVYTERSDVFSFSVILIQILTRQFPAPSDRFRRNPSRICEVERRQAHINLIEPTHPLLPIALQCLKDEAVERPSSQQLCQFLDAAKGTTKYVESLQQDVGKLLQEKEELIQEKDEQIQAVTKDLQVLEDVVEAMKEQLMNLSEQLELEEESVAPPEDAITQRDKEISEVRNLQSSEETSHALGNHIVQATPSTEGQVSMSWTTLPVNIAIVSFEQSSAVVGDKVCFKLGKSIWEFASASNEWNQIPTSSHCSGFSLVSIENELTMVGGWFENFFGNYKCTNKLHSFIKGKWVEKYPPMPTKRYACTAVYANHALLVVGGAQNNYVQVATVEILNTRSKQWSSVSSLPFPSARPSISICEQYVYVHATNIPSKRQYLVRCSLLSLTFSTPWPVIWEKVASLPVKGSTLVTVKGHLLALGGSSSKGDPTREIRQYSIDKDSWQVVNRMKVARSECTAALLPDNKLMVAGGASKRDPIELATVW